MIWSCTLFQRCQVVLAISWGGGLTSSWPISEFYDWQVGCSLRSVIPTAVNLQRCNISLSFPCSLCRMQPDDDGDHIFLWCLLARGIWSYFLDSFNIWSSPNTKELQGTWREWFPWHASKLGMLWLMPSSGHFGLNRLPTYSTKSIKLHAQFSTKPLFMLSCESLIIL